MYNQFNYGYTNMHDNTDGKNMNCCEHKMPCKCEPIVMPVKTCVVNRYFTVEQPVIVPVHTRVINNYVPCNRYYTQFTSSEETHCGGGTYPTEQ